MKTDKTNYAYIIRESKSENGKLISTINQSVFTSLKKAYEYFELCAKLYDGEIIQNKNGLKEYALLQYRFAGFLFSVTIEKRILQ